MQTRLGWATAHERLVTTFGGDGFVSAVPVVVPTQFSLVGRPTRIVLSGFVDAGRVGDNGLDASPRFDDLPDRYGGGVRPAIGTTSVVAGSSELEW